MVFVSQFPHKEKNASPRFASVIDDTLSWRVNGAFIYTETNLAQWQHDLYSKSAAYRKPILTRMVSFFLISYTISIFNRCVQRLLKCACVNLGDTCVLPAGCNRFSTHAADE